jgi:hypothetical protein
VSTIPTCMLLREGEAVHRVEGMRIHAFGWPFLTHSRMLVQPLKIFPYKHLHTQILPDIGWPPCFVGVKLEIPVSCMLWHPGRLSLCASFANSLGCREPWKFLPLSCRAYQQNRIMKEGLPLLSLLAPGMSHKRPARAISQAIHKYLLGESAPSAAQQ